MRTDVSPALDRISRLLIWGGISLIGMALLAVGLHAAYLLLATFPVGVGFSSVSGIWLTTLGVGTASSLAGGALSMRKRKREGSSIEREPTISRAA